jgi:hypothetical protein
MEERSMVAHLKQQISAEQQATQRGFYGLASVATHLTITARMEQAFLRVQVLRAAGKEYEAQALLFSDTFYEQGEEALCKSD